MRPSSSIIVLIGIWASVSASANTTLSREVLASDVASSGEVSMTALSTSEANRQALQSPQSIAEIEQPQHRLPHGGLTSTPSQQVLNALPRMAGANIAIQSANPGGAGVLQFSGFGGIHEGDNVVANLSELEPPDQGMAVNNNIVAEITNNVLRFFDATSGAPLTQAIALSVIFGVNPNIYGLSDPQVFFDNSSKRWYLTEVAYNATFNGFALAVSKTSDPLGAYYVYLFDASSSSVAGCGGVDCFPDYPKGGYNADAEFITADLFSNVSGNFVESAIFAIPKAKIEAGKSFNYVRFDDPNDFVVSPSVPAPGEPFSTTDNGSEFFMSAAAIFGSGNVVSVLAVTHTKNIVSNISSLQMFSTTVPTGYYGGGNTVPSTEPNVVGPYCASVGTTSAPSLDGGYSAFGATVQKAGGNLYAALAFGAKDGNGLNRDVIGWFEVQPDLTPTGLTATLVRQGKLVPPDGYSLSYPALGLTLAGSGMMGVTVTNVSANVTGGYPSAAVVQFTGTNFSGPLIVSGSGFTSDDGFSGCPGVGPGQVGRWGDYGAATVDAATGYIYTANEMIPNPAKFKRGKYANWGTFITRIY